MFRQSSYATTTNDTISANEDRSRRNSFAKIRLGFTSSNGYHRQILLGFMNDLASPEIDKGYDAPQLENLPDEMSFSTAALKLAIQGDGYFNRSNSYPLSIKTSVEGSVIISLDGVENFVENQKIYIYDAVTNEYHNIKKELFTINLQTGTLDNRFSLCFKRNTSAPNKEADDTPINVSFTNNDKTITINNKPTDTIIQSAELYNLLGQYILGWDINSDNQTLIQIPTTDSSSGTYILKLKTNTGTISKKVVFQ